MAEALVLPLGIIIVTLVALRLGVYTAASMRQLAHQRQQEELALEFMRQRIAEAQQRRRESALAWNGYRKFEIQRKEEEASGICSFYLVPHDRKPLPAYKPGQYLTFRLDIPGREKPVVRCYSLSDCPRPDRYRITIKRVGAPRGAPAVPPGLVSNYFHEQLADGDILDVQAPRGQFYLDPQQERPAVLIAGGVGITPLLSMIQTVVENKTGRELLLLYGVRNRAEHAFHAQLQQVVEQHPNVRMVVAYSQPAPADEAGEGRDYHHQGWIDIGLIKSYLQSTNYEFYICGPPPLMDNVQQQLTKWGVHKKDIHTEAFGPATVSKAIRQSQSAAGGQAPATAAPLCQVTFAKSNKKCGWDAACENLLDFALAHGVQIESGCRAGNCGTCVVAVKSGRVAYVTEHGADLEDGSCLACIAAPQGDLILDA